MGMFQEQILRGIPGELPEAPQDEPGISRAPARPLTLDAAEQKQAIKNALRYFPQDWHADLAPEFAQELFDYGQVYMHRFRPHYSMQARPLDEYPGERVDAKAIMHMIQNNLDPRVAQHPYELVTYGGNGTVFPNWAQYLLTMQRLAQLKPDQTLHLYSGHPMAVFPSPLGGPAVVVTNGMMIPQFSTDEEYRRLAALGATSYGQMTAGSFMYIGPQGIVHGTYLTLLGAAQIHLGLEPGQDLSGVVFVSSGLGGMSGAQAKASYISGAVGVVAEINPIQAKKLHKQGWVQELTDDLEQVVLKVTQHRKSGQPLSLGYVGNVIDLWRYLNDRGVAVDLGSDQTSLHAPYTGGYYPAGLSFDEAQDLMAKDPQGFKERVHESLKQHVEQVNQHVGRGMFFWDYGNSFLRVAEEAGAAVVQDGKFIYPSYVENIMGPQYFDYGFGPFRWVCTSSDAADLQTTDELAAQVIAALSEVAPQDIKTQMAINHKWIQEAKQNDLVVGSQARILYADMEGRRQIAHRFNQAICDKEVSAPIVLGRDHHDVSGTDSPYRETANIYDGSSHCADMAVHNFMGLGFQGASWASLHNGGGVGWGYSMNGGFGLVIDGSEEAHQKIDALFLWDVGNGLSRRAWAGNSGAQFAVKQAQAAHQGFSVTPAVTVDDGLVSESLTRVKKID